MHSPRPWRFDLESAGRVDLPAFPGPLLRGVLGLALHRRFGPEADTLFKPENAPAAYRWDTPIAPIRSLRAGSRWSVRIVTLADPGVFLDGVIDAFEAGLGDHRVPQRIVALTPLAHGGGRAPPADPEEPLDLAPRAAELSSGILRLASPAHLTRGGEFIRCPTALDVLHGVRLRAGRLGLAPPPRFESEVEESRGTMQVYRHPRHSIAQGRDYVLVGAVGTIAVRPTAAQALWLALAELIGVGSDTAHGLGVVRLEPDR